MQVTNNKFNNDEQNIFDINQENILEEDVFKYIINKKDENEIEKPIKIDNSISVIEETDENLIDTKFYKNHAEHVLKTISKIAKETLKPTLYLYSSGGGGHKSAKDAEMEKRIESMRNEIASILKREFGYTNELEAIKILFPDQAAFIKWCKEQGIIDEKDVLHDFVGALGEWASKQWDEAQKTGDVSKQEKLASKQWLSDKIFGPTVFIETLKTLRKTHPKEVISTQAMATPSILLAIKVYNVFYKPAKNENVKLHLYMTDMPTEYSSHFFHSLKKMGKYLSGKEYLVLHAPKPKDDINWSILCNLPDNQVEVLETSDFPVRPAFLKAVEQYQVNSKNPQVEIKVSHKDEVQLLQNVLKAQGMDDTSSFGLSDKSGSQTFGYKVQPEDEGFFLMLGSQPTKSAIENYVDQFISKAKKNKDKTYHLFAFTGKFEADKNCFYKELCAYIENKANEDEGWPTNLRILPLSFQDPKQLVSLELQCHTITRSGGATAMELLVLDEIKQSLGLPTKKRFVHAQKVENRELMDSIPVWEKGNYLFLEKQIGAKVVDPTTLFASDKDEVL